MARRSGVEPAIDEPRAFHLQHRYMAGLRFDGVWEYLVKTAAGRWRWRALPLLEAPSSAATRQDPEGAWWCVRRCAAVLAHCGLQVVSLPKGRGPRPGAEGVVNVLQGLLPSCEVQALDTVSSKSTTDVVNVLDGQGCALLRLERMAGNGGTASVCWVWMIGIETLHQVPVDGQMPSRTDGLMHALLVVGSRSSAPWGSGFGAKVFPLEDGSWKLCSVDAEVWRGRLAALIAVRPLEAN